MCNIRKQMFVIFEYWNLLFILNRDTVIEIEIWRGSRVSIVEKFQWIYNKLIASDRRREVTPRLPLW